MNHRSCLGRQRPNQTSVIQPNKKTAPRGPLSHLNSLTTFLRLVVPLVRNAAGQKLSKQTGARPLAPDTPGANLCQALTCLGQQPPAELARDAPGLIWDWAAANWDPELAGRETGDLVQGRF